MTAPTPDAVAGARKKYNATLPELDFAYRYLGPSEIAAAEENTECAWAEVLAAVRAECAAKVDAQADALDADIGNESAVIALRKLARTLEAHP